MKRLGQHFLTNKTKLQEIAKILDLKADDAVIEIGPGHGELTDELRIMNHELRIVAIEKDGEFIRGLQKKFAQDKNTKIVEGDALKMLPSIIHNSSFLPSGDLPKGDKIQNYKIVGNIPYYITGRLLRVISELENKPVLVVLTVQKEVAERICAEPPKMNLLAASVQFWAEPKIIDYIPKTDFQPQPKVDSAIIKFNLRKSDFLRLEKSNFQQLQQDYYHLIKILFKQPRKTILNNLASGIKHQTSDVENQRTKEKIIKILEELKINPGDRPQNLTIEQIKNLSGQLRY